MTIDLNLWKTQRSSTYWVASRCADTLSNNASRHWREMPISAEVMHIDGLALPDISPNTALSNPLVVNQDIF